MMLKGAVFGAGAQAGHRGSKQASKTCFTDVQTPDMSEGATLRCRE